MAIGTSVLGGMITATFLALFFIPLFYVFVVKVFGRKKRGAADISSTSPLHTVKE